MTLYTLLAVITVSIFVGAVLGIKLFAATINHHIDSGDADVYIKGKRVERIGMGW